MDLLAVELPPSGPPLATERQPFQLLHLPRGRRRGRDLLKILSNDLVEAFALALRNFSRLFNEPVIHSKSQIHGPTSSSHITCARGKEAISQSSAPSTQWLGGCIVLDAKGFIKTGPDLSPDELAAAGWPLPLPPRNSLPGVFAVGDIRAGNIKRVASAVGEGSIAVSLVHQVLRE